jgi:hypothetical protein
MPPEIYPQTPKKHYPKRRRVGFAHPPPQTRFTVKKHGISYNKTIGILRLFYDTAFRQREKGYLHKISEKNIIFPCS